MAKTRGKKEVNVVRTAIYLDEETHRDLRHLSIDRGVSMTELVRQAVDKLLKEAKKGGK